MFWRVGVALPEVGQSGAADETDLPIDNEQLAVIAVIEPGEIEPDERILFRHFHARLAHDQEIARVHLA